MYVGGYSGGKAQADYDGRNACGTLESQGVPIGAKIEQMKLGFPGVTSWEIVAHTPGSRVTPASIGHIQVLHGVVRAGIKKADDGWLVIWKHEIYADQRGELQ
jgi:hypothetical protein